MKKTFCFVFQHAASTELKQRAEAGSGGGYMNNIKVLSSSKRGQMSDDRVPQRSTQSKKQFGAPNHKQDKFKFKFQSTSNYAFLKICILVFRLQFINTALTEEKDFKMREALIKERGAQPLCSSSREQHPCKTILLPKCFLIYYNVRNHRLAGSWNCAIFSGRLRELSGINNHPSQIKIKKLGGCLFKILVIYLL